MSELEGLGPKIEDALFMAENREHIDSIFKRLDMKPETMYAYLKRKGREDIWAKIRGEA